MAGMTKYEETIARLRKRHSDKRFYEPAGRQFIPFYNTGERIRVRTTYGPPNCGLSEKHVWERTGTVGMSTGWWPTFLLMHRSNQIGSWDTLGEQDEIIAVQRGHTYVVLAGREVPAL